MGRSGVISSRVTSIGSKGEKTFDVSEVAPIVLFPVTEEDNQVDKGASEVMYICSPSVINLCALIMLYIKQWRPIKLPYCVGNIIGSFMLCFMFGWGL